MKRTIPYDVIIVGAGFGGLTAAACLAHKGQRVLLCERSGALGGCAGRFERGGYRFAAGATVGMGLEAGGVLHDLYGRLRIPLPKWEAPPVIMDIHLPDGAFPYWRSKTRWYEEASRQFPRESDRVIAFFEEALQVAQWLDPVIRRRPLFPPTDVATAVRLLSLADSQTVRLLPFLTSTIADRLQRFDLEKARRFLCFLNGQLIDSVQTTAEQCPAFLGYAALSTFHRGAFAIRGGLATVAEDLAHAIIRDGGEIRRHCDIRTVERSAAGWLVTNQYGEGFMGKRLVLNNSLHSLHHLLPEGLRKAVAVDVAREQRRPAWGAFVLYVGCKDTSDLPGRGGCRQASAPGDRLFHQFIGSYDLPPTEGNQFLLSLSSPEDRLFAPAGKRSITISTHTAVAQWWEPGRYDSLKAAYQQRILDTVSRSFPGFQTTIEQVLPGTPVTWARFTGRHQGKVGGYIPTGPLSWLRSYPVRSGQSDLWFCGDTVFPGAGTLGTALSGMTVADQMTR
ncbi:phytoene dehydrogenase, putative [Heliomicrobium modesticaldum Ice1]|uniref:Phytoene dehydrogenase, putative n=1 Tax=Heliobacterium modesticaldum (strain ATCC 51547 / Ice1) TaxID=498761 RepID=B0TA37_HELMI|nr:NAD(P)/FAD-dependent oxidoreductase [Heliomicrobium modesticaldum]ABZ83574.1 phytoene dehydrogenase, putative [Heliomicrobium modesticaldum Ice1]